MPYTVDELYGKLSRADAAGDKEAAKVIADEIRQMQAAPADNRPTAADADARLPALANQDTSNFRPSFAPNGHPTSADLMAYSRQQAGNGPSQVQQVGNTGAAALHGGYQSLLGLAQSVVQGGPMGQLARVVGRAPPPGMDPTGDASAAIGNYADANRKAFDRSPAFGGGVMGDSGAAQVGNFVGEQVLPIALTRGMPAASGFRVGAEAPLAARALAQVKQAGASAAQGLAYSQAGEARAGDRGGQRLKEGGLLALVSAPLPAGGQVTRSVLGDAQMYMRPKAAKLLEDLKANGIDPTNFQKYPGLLSDALEWTAQRLPFGLNRLASGAPAQGDKLLAQQAEQSARNVVERDALTREHANSRISIDNSNNQAKADRQTYIDGAKAAQIAKQEQLDAAHAAAAKAVHDQEQVTIASMLHSPSPGQSAADALKTHPIVPFTTNPQLESAKNHIGENIGAMSNGRRINVSPDIGKAFNEVLASNEIIPQLANSPLVKKAIQTFVAASKSGNPMRGEDVAKLRSMLSTQASSMEGFPARAMRDLREHVDDALMSGLSGGEKKQFLKYREQYRLADVFRSKDIEKHGHIDIPTTASAIERAVYQTGPVAQEPRAFFSNRNAAARQKNPVPKAAKPRLPEKPTREPYPDGPVLPPANAPPPPKSLRRLVDLSNNSGRSQGLHSGSALGVGGLSYFTGTAPTTAMVAAGGSLAHQLLRTGIPQRVINNNAARELTAAAVRANQSRLANKKDKQRNP